MPRLRGHARPLQAKEGPMAQLVKKRRPVWVTLVVSALVASLLTVGASPAGAVTDKADNLPAGKACVGESTL